jgi:hypothetical protein
MNGMRTVQSRQGPFAKAYPNVARWVHGYGWIEIGEDLPGRSFIRALDEGGLIWEGEPAYPSVDAALQALDDALAKWLHEELGR